MPSLDLLDYNTTLRLPKTDERRTLAMHYAAGTGYLPSMAADAEKESGSWWTATNEVLWRAFCMTWVTVAWAMLIGRE